MKSNITRFSLQAKLNRLIWQYYSSDGDRTQLNREIGQTREVMHHLLLDMPLDDDSPEVLAGLVMLKIESDPEISGLRDTFDHNHGNLAPEIAAHHLLDLCKLRNQLARAHGYGSYPMLALRSQGLSDKAEDYRSILKYLHRPVAKDSIGLPDIPCMEKYWEVFEEQFGPASDETYTPEHYHKFVRGILQAIDQSHEAERLEVVIKEQPNASGIALDLSEGDSRRAGILIRPSGVRAFFTAAHELGHALLYLHRTSGPNETPAWLDEGYACLIEDEEHLIRFGLQELRIDNDEISNWLRVNERLRVAEHNRIWASVLTEDSLWSCSDHSELTEKEKIDLITDQCQEFYHQYLGATYLDPLRWALDSFRSLDPVYIHSYALAREFASLMLRESRTMPIRYDTSHAAIANIIKRVVSSI